MFFVESVYLNLKKLSPCFVLYREQVQKVFVGLEGWCAAVNCQQVIDVAVQVLQLAQVDLVLFDVVRQGLIQRDQILQVDAQDGHFKACAIVVNSPVVAVVAARREQLCHLTQGLRDDKDQESNDNWVFHVREDKACL